jgi:iron complex transport system substrate-binding protein
MALPRIVSLLPSATEIVFRLGAGPCLVGRSEDCDFPPEVRARPVVMRARTFDSEAASATIDARVQGSRGRGESLYTLDLELLRRLQPDVILTQDLCGVCSVTEAEVIGACDRAGVQPTIISASPRRLEDVQRSIIDIGDAIGRGAEARQLVGELGFGPASPSVDTGARVVVAEWVDPLILAGLWVPDMIRQARGQVVGPPAGSPGQRSSWRDLRSMDVDLVIISPCSFDVPRTRRELAQTELRRKDYLLPALGVWVADEAFFSRPGPRLAAGIELLKRLVGGRSVDDLPMDAERWQAEDAPPLPAS